MTHTAEEGSETSYNPMPEYYPGTFSRDEFTVVITKGKLEAIDEQLPAGTSFAAASQAAHALLPTDAKPAIALANLGTCAIEQLVSRSLAATGPNGGGTIFVTYESEYALQPEIPYNSLDNRQVKVSELRGSPEVFKAGGPFGALLCIS